MSIDELVHEIHTSEIRSYRGCRRRWNWSFGLDLQPLTTAVPLEFGVAFHRAMEAMYNPETWNAPLTLIAQFAEAAFIDECQRQRGEFNRLVDRGLDDDQERDYDKLTQLGRGMIHWYVQNHLPVADFTPIYVEQKFQVPITDPNGEPLLCKCHRCWTKYLKYYAGHPEEFNDYPPSHTLWQGLPVVYEGRVDVIVRDNQGNYWIVDWKTAIRMMNEDSDVILELDDQVVGYVWALRKKLGLNIRGFRYIELKKGFPQPPPQLKVVRLGRSFSVSQCQETDAETFRRTVEARDPEAYKAGLYDVFIDWLILEGPKFIQDHVVRKTDRQLENFGIHVWQQAVEMIDPNLALYPSPGRFSCGFCAYREPCLDKESGGDFEYALETMFERKPRYYALKDASTDKKGIG